MKITLRADKANGIHTRFTIFMNGANCGQLCMREDEAHAFYMIIEHGCLSTDEFIGKGHWGKVGE